MSRRQKLAYLTLLYFAQGLPYGFQATALPAILYSHGVSLATLGFTGVLALPWALKLFWAPFVDRTASRKVWIMTMQSLLTVACLGAMWRPDGPTGLVVLCALVLVMNLLAATQDIATDALAVDLLADEEVGLGNSAQVVGYKVGMLTGGGLLVWASATIGERGLFLAMAGLMALVALIAAVVPEPARIGREGASTSVRAVLRTLERAALTRSGLVVIAFIATYKLGETASDLMWKPFLLDRGFTVTDVAKVAGVYGMVASIGGSLLGGWLAHALRLRTALAIVLSLRLVSLLLRVAVAYHAAPTLEMLSVVTWFEELGGGALTTVAFAIMMINVDPRVGGTHFTALATVEFLGKSPGGMISGFVAGAFGFGGLFVGAAALSLVPFAFLSALRTHRTASPPTHAPA
jgi:MFS transporter, PAT family, beta-lactamase induction signal transducer AmpG